MPVPFTDRDTGWDGGGIEHRSQGDGCVNLERKVFELGIQIWESLTRRCYVNEII